MPATKKTSKDIEPGTLVTARITDDNGVEHTFHGTYMGTREYVTSVTQWGSRTNYARYPAEPAIIDADHQPETYARLYSATGNPMGKDGLPDAGPDHFFNYAEISVNLDSKNVTLTKATKAGHAWVQANQSIENRRRMLVEQVTALDPTLGEAVDRLFGDIEDDAYERGKDAEWRANNY